MLFFYFFIFSWATSSSRSCSHSPSARSPDAQRLPNWSLTLTNSWTWAGLLNGFLLVKHDTSDVLEVEQLCHIFPPFFFILYFSPLQLSVWRNTMGLWSFWSFSLLAFVSLLRPFQPKFVAQAEISSLGATDRFYRLEVTPLEAAVTRKSKVDNGTKVFSAFETEEAGALKPSNGKHAPESGLWDQAPIRVKTAPNYPEIPAEKYSDMFEDDQRRRTMFGNSFPDTRKRAKRSAGATHAENVDRSTSGEAQSGERLVETVQGVSNSRVEYRRAGEEARGSSPRQSEPHLDTSTFALSGDSAHNQAMVHWSGHNSSVSYSLTKTLRRIWYRFPLTLISNAPDLFPVWNAYFSTILHRFTWICAIFTHSCVGAQERTPLPQTNYLTPDTVLNWANLVPPPLLRCVIVFVVAAHTEGCDCMRTARLLVWTPDGCLIVHSQDFPPSLRSVRN